MSNGADDPRPQDPSEEAPSPQQRDTSRGEQGQVAAGHAGAAGPADPNRPGADPQPSTAYDRPVPENPYAQAPQAPGPYGSGGQPRSTEGWQAAPAAGAYPESSQPRQRRRGGVAGRTMALGMVAAALIGAGAYGVVDAVDGSDGGSVVGTGSRDLIVNDTDSVNEITGAAAKASPSVVTISSSDGQNAGSGSGVVLDDQGHILTNTHVVTMDGQASDPDIEVQLSDGTVTTAQIVGTDPLSDLAVIQVDHDGLVPAELGSSADLNVGDAAIAIGAPLGLAGTVTDGIISTTDRTIAVASSAAPETPAEGDTSQEDQGGSWGDFFFDYGQGDSSQGQQESVFLNVIQTDASINPGNSGGALVDAQGRVIGINVAIASAAGSSSEAGVGSIGVGFSIPIDHAKRVAEEIIETGEATHGYLGASVAPAAADDGQSQVFSQGALVRSVESGSPADDAGLREGDIIRSFNGHETLDADELTAAVRELPAGGTGELVYERNGSESTVEVTVADAADA